jgi:hypothetical protein
MKVVLSMKHRLLLPGVIALVLLFAACSPPPPLRDDKLLQDTSLITTDAACSSPCWRGITPGKTPWSDALSKLQDDKTLESVNVQTDDKSAALVAEFQQKGGSSCCQMFSKDGKNVNVLFLRIAPTVKLGQLIEAQGEPKYLVGSPYSDDQAVMNLIYPDKSLVVYAFVAGTTGALSESSEIVGVLYMTPSDMDLLIKTSSLHAWAGYKAYQDYDSSAFEVTPSVTLTPTPNGG